MKQTKKTTTKAVTLENNLLEESDHIYNPTYQNL